MPRAGHKTSGPIRIYKSTAYGQAGGLRIKAKSKPFFATTLSWSLGSACSSPLTAMVTFRDGE